MPEATQAAAGNQQQQYRNPPRTIKITLVQTYNEKYSLIEYTVYGVDLKFIGLYKTEKLTDEIRSYDVNPDTVYIMYSNGPYINFLGVSHRY